MHQAAQIHTGCGKYLIDTVEHQSLILCHHNAQIILLVLQFLGVYPFVPDKGIMITLHKDNHRVRIRETLFPQIGIQMSLFKMIFHVPVNR